VSKYFEDNLLLQVTSLLDKMEVSMNAEKILMKLLILVFWQKQIELLLSKRRTLKSSMEELILRLLLK
jgi:hypothetical protein